MLKVQERFQMHIQVLMYYKPIGKVMKYLNKRIYFKKNFSRILPLLEIRTAQRVLSFAIGCFIRSLITIGKLLFEKFAFAV